MTVGVRLRASICPECQQKARAIRKLKLELRRVRVWLRSVQQAQKTKKKIWREGASRAVNSGLVSTAATIQQLRRSEQ